MKTIKLISFKRIIAIFSMCVLFVGCDLELNTGYDFNAELDLVEPFENMTAWEWIQTRNVLNEDGTINTGEFDYLIEAIKVAGMVDEYNQTATKDRTYLLLNNNAFLGKGDVINIVTGSDKIPVGETPAQTMARANIEKLRTVLKYHIVTTYINQVPVLYKYDTDYLFQTLIPGEDGLIAFRRTNRYGISINNSDAPLPSSATSESEGVYNHNYIFSNGIGHQIQDPVRNKPY
ncbi:hypothetical protein [Mariniflexile sp.]|uniref:hypothetical protein n=1 Tax=Mariniflexile sp. TaxID=1979402 RepID=UPI004048792F